MAKHTDQDESRVAHDTDRDKFLSADEAVQYGLFDRALTSRSEAVA